MTDTNTATHRRRGFTHESVNAGTTEWYTPAWLLARIGLTYDLDVCSPGADRSNVSARRHLAIADDGLSTPWFGTVWCNPPYGRATQTWMRKLSEHGDGVALVFARTDTAWFQEAAATATVICLINGRIRFIDGRTGKPGGAPGAGSALIAYGAVAAQAVEAARLGLCVRP